MAGLRVGSVSEWHVNHVTRDSHSTLLFLVTLLSLAVLSAAASEEATLTRGRSSETPALAPCCGTSELGRLEDSEDCCLSD